MALHKQTFITRSLSAVVFVVMLLGALLLNIYSFSALFFLVALIALTEFMQLSVKLGFRPYRGLAYLSGIYVYVVFSAEALFPQIPPIAAMLKAMQAFTLVLPFLILSRALFDKRDHALQNAFFTLMAVIYACLPFALLNQVVVFSDGVSLPSYHPHLLLGAIFLIWANDTFAYLGGSFFGKHKMIPRVSPGKTWEGTIIGVLVAFALSFSFKFFLNTSHPNLWPVLGLCIPVLATLGDLVESLLKRKAGVKDSGNLMPGHGGALDRFDSLIFVSPFVYALVQFIA